MKFLLAAGVMVLFVVSAVGISAAEKNVTAGKEDIVTMNVDNTRRMSRREQLLFPPVEAALVITGNSPVQIGAGIQTQSCMVLFITTHAAKNNPDLEFTRPAAISTSNFSSAAHGKLSSEWWCVGA